MPHSPHGTRCACSAAAATQNPRSGARVAGGERWWEASSAGLRGRVPAGAPRTAAAKQVGVRRVRPAWPRAVGAPLIGRIVRVRAGLPEARALAAPPAGHALRVRQQRIQRGLVLLALPVLPVGLNSRPARRAVLACGPGVRPV